EGRRAGRSWFRIGSHREARRMVLVRRRTKRPGAGKRARFAESESEAGRRNRAEDPRQAPGQTRRAAGLRRRRQRGSAAAPAGFEQEERLASESAPPELTRIAAVRGQASSAPRAGV